MKSRCSVLAMSRFIGTKHAEHSFKTSVDLYDAYLTPLLIMFIWKIVGRNIGPFYSVSFKKV